MDNSIPSCGEDICGRHQATGNPDETNAVSEGVKEELAFFSFFFWWRTDILLEDKKENKVNKTYIFLIKLYPG